MAINYTCTQTASVTTNTTVYNPTTAGVQATVIGLLVANTTSSTVTCTVSLVNATSTVTTNIVYGVTIPSGSSLDIVQSAKIVIPQGYFIKVTSTGTVDVTVSSVEVS